MTDRIHPRVHQALIANDVTFTVHNHAELEEPVNSPADFSRLSGVAIERVTKTVLFCERGGDKRPVLVTAPIASRIDLKSVASVLDYGSLHVAPRDLLSSLLDYPPSGVSPFGAPDGVPIVVDDTVLASGAVTVGAGVAGVELEIASGTVVEATDAIVTKVVFTDF